MIFTPGPETAAFDFGALIETIATIVALLGVIASIWIARRGQKQDLLLSTAEAERAERAERAGAASAERAENAAALTIDTMARMAEALDKIASRGLGGPTIMAEAPPARVAWSLTHFQGDKYMLTNVGEAPAFNVQISAHESLMKMGPWTLEERVGPGEAITFMALRTMGTSDSTITVEWSDDPEDDERHSWRYPLPPRPRRR